MGGPVKLAEASALYDKADQDRTRKQIEHAIRDTSIALTGGALAVLLDGTPISPAINALNFASTFAVTETPTGQANISIVSPISRSLLPSQIAYEDEANSFIAGQVIGSDPGTPSGLTGVLRTGGGIVIGPRNTSNVYAAGLYTRFGEVNQVIGGIQNGDMSLTYNAYYSSGWKAISGGVALAFGTNAGAAFSWNISDNPGAGNALTWTEYLKLDAGTLFPASSGGVDLGKSTLPFGVLFLNNSIRWVGGGGTQTVFQRTAENSSTVALTAGRWYRVAQNITASGRGNALVTIYTTGNELTPGVWRFQVWGDWADGGSIVQLQGDPLGAGISAVRLTRNAGSGDIKFIDVKASTTTSATSLQAVVQALDAFSSNPWTPVAFTDMGTSHPPAGETLMATLTTAIGANHTVLGVATTTRSEAFGVSVDGSTRIGLLGILDASGTRFGGTGTVQPNDVLSYDPSVNMWRARFLQTTVGTGVLLASANGDGTFGVFANDGRTPSGTSIAGPTPVVTAIYGGFIIDMGSTPPANFVWDIQWTNSANGNTGGPMRVTSQKAVFQFFSANSSVPFGTTATTFQFKVSQTGGTAAVYGTSSAALAASTQTEVNAFGLIVASQIACVNLAAISADLGVVAAGVITDAIASGSQTSGIFIKSTAFETSIPSGWTSAISFSGTVPSTVKRLINFGATALPTWTDGQSMAWVNMNATASTHFIRHDKFQLRHDGSMFMTKKVIFLTSGTSWTVPADFNPFLNSVELIGGGGDGAPGVANTRAGGGGGGGGYSKIIAYNPGNASSITYAIGGSGGGTTSWDSGAVTAPGGGNASGSTGGAGGVGNLRTGGIGGTGQVGTGNQTGGGGGGGAGLNENGHNGQNGVSGAAGGAGGNPQGGAGGAAGADGSPGTVWTSNPGGVSEGAGGGAGGGDANGVGGNRGGGGGGGNSTGLAGLPGSTGAPGIIVITYFPIGAL